MNLRRILLLLGLFGLTLVVASSFGNWTTITDAFRRAHWYLVPLVIAAQAVDYYCNARYYQTFFSITGHRVGLRRLYEASLGINFANQAIPSGGVAGATYLTQAVKMHEVPPAQATLAQIGRYIFTFLSYFIVLAFGFVTLFFSDDLNRISVRLVIFLMLIILIAGLILLVVFSERHRLEALVKPAVRSLNWVGQHLLQRSQPIVQWRRISRFLDEFYDGYTQLVAHKKRWTALVWWSLGGNIAEVLTIYVVFVGFGYWVNPGVVITGYTLAIMASVAGLVVNGLGVYEAGMIGTFTALGTPFALALTVVLVYRTLNMALFLPVGLYYYRRHLKEA